MSNYFSVSHMAVSMKIYTPFNILCNPGAIEGVVRISHMLCTSVYTVYQTYISIHGLSTRHQIVWYALVYSTPYRYSTQNRTTTASLVST